MERKYFKRDIQRIGEMLLLFIYLQLQFGLLFHFIFACLKQAGILSLHKQTIDGYAELLIGLVSTIVVYTYGKERLHVSVKDHRKPFPCVAILNGSAVLFFLTVVLGIVLTILRTLWTKWTGFTFIEPNFEFTSNTVYNISLVISSLVIAPIFEELIFRGVILQSLARYNKSIAILFSSLLFGMLHMNLEQALPTMFLGMFFGYVALKYDSILLTIALHFINNLMAVLQLNFPSFLIPSMWIELFLITYGMWVLIKEWPILKKEINSYPYTKEVFKQWTVLLFFFIFLFFGTLSMLGTQF